ncbi:carbohydrate-binding module family 50 protein [Trametes coccinea BRFM310]|uniref:Carbohydrate-binding module family 50 protein n=1 Tax=Trametes coccinea (strain BRFM310) TaxID=1353009 RepID=A0A1Y2IEF5_TRAC3|nr:carbohydrate-binding module family 50 protein [Trametes coccinea BRFM310]
MFFRSTFIATAAAAVVLLGARAQEPNCARNYTVVLGDTCDGISAKTNTSTYQLATVNADKIDAACDNLAVGEDCDVVDVVQSGDSCAAIADDAGTTLDILLANNPNVNSECTNIYPGEVLCTADEVIVVNSTSTSV